MSHKKMIVSFDVTRYFGSQGYGVRRVYAISDKLCVVKEKGKLRYRIPCHFIEVELEDFND